MLSVVIGDPTPAKAIDQIALTPPIRNPRLDE
jgi:hypothetical protein